MPDDRKDAPIKFEDIDPDAFPFGDAYEGSPGPDPHAHLNDQGASGPGAGPVIALGEWDAGDDQEPIPPRGWLLGNTFCRRFVSALIADGAVGKTALRITQLLSLATGRALTGEHVFCRCRVLLISLEDDRQELRRRVRAARIHHGITAEDVKGWLYLATPRGLRIAEHDAHGKIAAGKLETSLRETITRRKIDVVCLDPFVKAHGVEENANREIDFATDILAQIAVQLDCAIDAPHHVSKGAAIAGDANKARGASAFKDAARLVHTLTRMTPEEAALFGVAGHERHSLVRLDSGKVNIAPPMDKAVWFRLVSVNLGNGDAVYPKGDDVQAVERWYPPDLWTAMTDPVANRVLDRIDGGLPDGRRFSPAPQAKDDQQPWRIVRAEIPTYSEQQAKTIIATWIKNGVLKATDYHDPIVRHDRKGLFVVAAKRPGLLGE